MMLWRQKFMSMENLIKTFPLVEESFLEMVRAICKGETTAHEIHDLVVMYNLQRWIPEWRRMELEEVAMWVIDYLLDGNNVEVVGGDMNVSSYRPDFMYVNLGETYTPTVAYDYRTERFRITSQGDMV